MGPQSEVLRPLEAAGVAGFLAFVTILLDRFHGFLRDALTVQSRATSEVEREIATGDPEPRRAGHELHHGVCHQVTAALLACRALVHSAGSQGTHAVILVLLRKEAV